MIDMGNKPFNLLVGVSEGLKGIVKAPPSKSYTTRAIIIGSLSQKAKVINPLACDDTLSAVKAWKRLGADIKIKGGSLEIKGLAGKLNYKNRSINVGESGTLLRMMMPILALGKGRFVINGKGTLLKRPNKPMAQALLALGVDIRGRDKDFRLPIILESKGGIPGGIVKVDANMSSQVISSLLNIAPFIGKDTSVIIKDKLVSAPYIDITIDVLNNAGIKIQKRQGNRFFIAARQGLKPVLKFVVHGDYSSAAFLIAASCLVQSDVTIKDLVKDKQGDKEIVSILRKMGAKIIRQESSINIKGPFALKGVEINCRNTPDLVPVLCVLGCFARGVTHIRDIGHLAYKESNRIIAPVKELKRLGARISISNNDLVIRQSVLRSGHVDSWGDHRIAMALVIAGLKTGRVVIKNAGCISKSYPDFIKDLKLLGADLKVLPR